MRISATPLYETHLVLFYARQRFPSPPAIGSEDDLKIFRVGGIHGFNHDYYGRRLAIDTGRRIAARYLGR